MTPDDGTDRRERLSESMMASDAEMEMTVEDRIHIVPLGYERDRVIVPPLRMGADAVTLVMNAHDQDDERPDYYDDIYEAFDEAAIEVSEVECDIFDLYDALGTIAGLIQGHGQEDIYVNLATGGKVTAIAGMIACMVTEVATPYYVSAKEYGDHQQQPVAEKVSGISNLPTYPIDAPAPEQVRMLEYIADEGPVSKQELIEYAEENNLPFIAGYEAGDPKGKYRKLDSVIIEPLSEDGSIFVTEQGRKKMVRITESGENTLHAFGYMLSSDIDP